MGQPTTTTAPMDRFRVSIVTMGPGDAAWEKFGHNMLRIHDTVSGADASYNWGLFDFDSGFIGKFLQGRLLYSMAPLNTEKTLYTYTHELNRDIWEQELNLSPFQKRTLLDFCEWNYRNEPDYRYDYYKDNCSTRVRDAVDLVLGGQIKRKASTMPSPYNFRSETNRLMASSPVFYTAIYYILGQPIDNSMSVWDEMFIPMRLRERLNQMTFLDETGREVPIVKSEVLLNKSSRTPPPETPPQLIGWFLVVGLLLGGLPAWLVGKVIRGGDRPIRLSFIAITVAWSLLAGFGGWFMLYAWTTDHWAVRHNENILQLCPLLLPLVVAIPRALARRPVAGKMAFVLASIALAASVLGLLLKVLPSMYQVNANIIALAIPANAGLAWSMWRIQALAPVPQGSSVKEKGLT